VLTDRQHVHIAILHNQQTQGACVAQLYQWEIMGRAPLNSGPGSIPGPSVWGLWWTNYNWDSSLPECFRLPATVNPLFRTHPFIIAIDSVCNWPASKPETSAIILSRINWIVTVMATLHFLWGRDEVYVVFFLCWKEKPWSW
jgi:hypothetical protein